jgi:ferrous-iron efflux pump FieF
VTTTPEDANLPAVANLMRAATYASVTVAVVLVAVKFFAWITTDSVAILATLVDSLLDALASLFTLIAVRHSLSPADREHRFGHGKAEALAALAQAAFICGSSVLLLFEAFHRLLQPQIISKSEVGIWVMVFSVVVTVALVAFQLFVVKRSGSLAISADSIHYRGDVLVNLAVIVALLSNRWFDNTFIDPLFGAAIALYILYSAWQIVSGALDMLMDRELPLEERQRIREIAIAHPEVSDIHDLRTRRSGQTVFIQLHLELDPKMQLMQSHTIADAVEMELHAAFDSAEVIIHQDPAGLDEGHRQFT